MALCAIHLIHNEQFPLEWYFLVETVSYPSFRNSKDSCLRTNSSIFSANTCEFLLALCCLSVTENSLTELNVSSIYIDDIDDCDET